MYVLLINNQQVTHVAAWSDEGAPSEKDRVVALEYLDAWSKGNPDSLDELLDKLEHSDPNGIFFSAVDGGTSYDSLDVRRSTLDMMLKPGNMYSNNLVDYIASFATKAYQCNTPQGATFITKSGVLKDLTTATTTAEAPSMFTKVRSVEHGLLFKSACVLFVQQTPEGKPGMRHFSLVALLNANVYTGQPAALYHLDSLGQNELARHDTEATLGVVKAGLQKLFKHYHPNDHNPYDAINMYDDAHANC
jgi:hypothetical protein